jgi:hypothetical protein
VLREFEFPVELVFGPAIHAGGLRERFDVLIFHTGLPAASRRNRVEGALRGGRDAVPDDDVAKVVAALPPFEDWSRAADRRVRLETDKAIPALRDFVERGGTLIALGDQIERIVAHLELPVEVGVFVDRDGERRRASSSDFFVPGSLLWVDVGASDPVGLGCLPRVAAMFRRSPVLSVKEVGADRATATASYAERDVLASGWAIGAEHLVGRAAAVRVKLGAGSVHLFGADVIYRGQPLSTFKLLFNAILAGPARKVAGVGS